MKPFTCLLIFIVWSLTAYSQINVGVEYHQPGTVYFKDGTIQKGKILVFKKDSLLTSGVMKNRFELTLNSETQKVNFNKIDSLDLNGHSYKWFKYYSSIDEAYYPAFGELSYKDDKLKVFVVNDAGTSSTMSDYSKTMIYILYVNINGKNRKINRGGHGSLQNQLIELFPNCEAVIVNKKERRLKYDDMMELILKAREECL